jgi:hypothetical protein
MLVTGERTANINSNKSHNHCWIYKHGEAGRLEKEEQHHTNLIAVDGRPTVVAQVTHACERNSNSTHTDNTQMGGPLLRDPACTCIAASEGQHTSRSKSMLTVLVHIRLAGSTNQGGSCSKATGRERHKRMFRMRRCVHKLTATRQSHARSAKDVDKKPPATGTDLIGVDCRSAIVAQVPDACKQRGHPWEQVQERVS